MRRYHGACGEVVDSTHVSKLLEHNPLGDPAERAIGVYLPAGYDESRRYPVLYALAGFTGSGRAFGAWRNFTENLPERLDRLIGERAMEPAVVVFPDAFTSLGGNQYINSSAIGPWGDYLTQELVPWVEGRFAVANDRHGRGVFGKSSGGYGALMQGLLYPETWSAIACHSGDLYFEYAYKPDFTILLDVLANYERSVDRFIESFARSPKPKGREIHALMLIAMAATYDPDPSAPRGFHLPMDLRTGEIDTERWRSWLRWDPIERVADLGQNLATMSEVYFDCGTRDQYRLLYGARMLVQRLERAGIAHHYEEFDDDHSGLDYRYDVSLPRLARALTGTA